VSTANNKIEVKTTKEASQNLENIKQPIVSISTNNWNQSEKIYYTEEINQTLSCLISSAHNMTRVSSNTQKEKPSTIHYSLLQKIHYTLNY